MKTTSLFGALALCLAAPATAEIEIKDAYARVSTPMSKAGAAFMMIANTADQPDRLMSARSDIAARVELHTHKDIGDGVMQMVELEDGIAIPASGLHALARGGDHVMFMGLRKPLAHGDVVRVTLVFERAGPIELDIAVDLDRAPTMGHGHGGTNGHKQD